MVRIRLIKELAGFPAGSLVEAPANIAGKLVMRRLARAERGRRNLDVPAGQIMEVPRAEPARAEAAPVTTSLDDSAAPKAAAKPKAQPRPKTAAKPKAAAPKKGK